MKKHIQSAVLGLSLLGASGALYAQQAVSDAWVRATVANQKATGMFATITSTQEGMRLVSASSDIAGVTQIHEMAMDKDVMRMRELPNGLAIEKDKALELKPGGYHVMLLDLKRAPKVGETVNVTLTFEDGKGQRKDVAVAADVRALNAKPMGGMKH
ncbi:copper chaperone PCu(A)C [Comamonadaceae bacterium M7527]|nr:copper chaperone PCu(A)C [Comamonadaceae bacterium M7527]